jgi:hypothetical protein
MLKCAPLLAAVLVMSAPVPAGAQSAVEGHASVGLVNLIGPAFAAGADLVRPSGATVGVAGLLTSGASDLSSFGAVLVRAGGQQRGPGTRGFLVAELGLVAPADCCGPLVVVGINGGATFWRSRPWGVRLEGRGLISADGGFVVIAQAGLTFR